jgi:glycerol-3-phosphate dehydrogenase
VQDASAGSTQTVSREHTIEIAASGLLTVTGGKWTTYRSMAEDVMNHALAAKLLPLGASPDCLTAHLPLLGADSPCNPQPHDPDVRHASEPDFVRFAVSHEFARTVEDVLARRSRALFLNAQIAQELAPATAQALCQQGLQNPQLPAFRKLAQQYQHCP